MEKQSHPQPRSSHRGLVALYLCLLSGPLLAQTAPGSLSLANDRYTVGQRFTVDLQVENADPLQIKLSQPDYPAALSLLAADQHGSTWEKTPGLTVKGTKISLTFRVAQAGIVNLGPFRLTTPTGDLTIPSRALFLLQEDEAQKRYPLEVRWKLPAGPFFKGQDIPLILEVRNLQNLLKPTGLDFDAPGNGILEKAPGLGDIEIMTVGEDRLFNIPWASWILIPNSSGTVNLPTASFAVGGLNRRPPAQSLTVLALPDEVGTSRAVGDFTFAATAERGTGDEAGELKVKLELKGKGNFPYLVLPPVALEGFTLLAKQEGNGFRPTSDGYQGSLTQQYRFSPNVPGSYDIHLPGMTWFNPAVQKVVSLPEHVVSLQFDAVGTAKPAPKSDRRVLDWAGVQAARSFNLAQWPGWWGLAPGLVVGLVLLLWPRGRGPVVLAAGLVLLMSASLPEPEAFTKALAASADDDGAAAQKLWDGYLAGQPHEPGVWYNKAVLYEKTGQTARAVHAYRQALQQGFSGGQAQKDLQALESRENILDQAGTWSGWWLDGLFGAALLVGNLSLVSLGLALRRRTPGLIILAVILLTAAVSLATASQSAAWQNQLAQAVLGPEAGPLRRVPGDLAEEWVSLKAGTPLRVLGTSGDYDLVQTTYGLEGWVRRDLILPLGP